MKEYIIKIGDEPDIIGSYLLKEEAKELVRCKDCIHRPLLKKFDDKQVVFTLPVFPDDVCPYKAKCSFDLTYPKDDWFCANGELR